MIFGHLLLEMFFDIQCFLEYIMLFLDQIWHLCSTIFPEFWTWGGAENVLIKH